MTRSSSARRGIGIAGKRSSPVHRGRPFICFIKILAAGRAFMPAFAAYNTRRGERHGVLWKRERAGRTCRIACDIYLGASGQQRAKHSGRVFQRSGRQSLHYRGETRSLFKTFPSAVLKLAGTPRRSYTAAKRAGLKDRPARFALLFYFSSAGSGLSAKQGFGFGSGLGRHADPASRQL